MRTIPKRLTVAHNGDEWAGTFQVVLDAVVRDMLDDGPFGAVLTFDADTDTNCMDMEVTVIGIDPQNIHTAEVGTFLRHNLYAIEIP